MSEKTEPKEYLYEPSENDISRISKRIRKTRLKELRESRYIPPQSDSHRTHRVHLPRKPLS